VLPPHLTLISHLGIELAPEFERRGLVVPTPRQINDLVLQGAIPGAQYIRGRWYLPVSEVPKTVEIIAALPIARARVAALQPPPTVVRRPPDIAASGRPRTSIVAA
jgi:hypothetical protein